MKLWILILQLHFLAFLHCLPLRPSDARNYHGHILNYNRNHRQGFFPRSRARHAHFQPPPTRSAQSAPVEAFLRKGGVPIETYLRNGGAKLHQAAIYEVPSNKHYNDPRSGHELDLRLRSLVEKYYNSDGKTTLKPPVILSTTSPAVKRNKPQEVQHIVKSPSTVLSHFLNVEMREFHEQPVQTTKVEQKHIPDPAHVRSTVQRRKKPGPKLPTKSYPLGLQFLNKNAKSRQTIPNILMEKHSLPLVKIRNKPSKAVKPSPTTPMTTTPSPTTTTTETAAPMPSTTTTTAPPPKTTTNSSPISTTPSIPITYPQTVGDTTTSLNAGLQADMGLNDPLFSISVDSLLGDAGMMGSEPLAAHDHGHSHDSVAAPSQNHDTGHNHHGHNQKVDSGHHHFSAVDHHHGGHGGHASSHVAHSHNTQSPPPSTADQNVDTASNALDKLFVGMFNHHVRDEPGLKNLHKQEEIIPVNRDLSVAVNTPRPNDKIMFEKTTVHAKPITKRGIHGFSGYVSRSPSYLDNMLNMNALQTTPPPPPRYRQQSHGYFATTPPSLETQINRQRMSAYLSAKMSTSNADVPPPSSPANVPKVQTTPEPMVKQKAKPSMVNSSQNVSQKDLVHLRGIHIMFSNGKQDTSGKIPTIHLTASISERGSKNVSKSNAAAAPTSVPVQTTEKATQKPTSSVVDKIVGTAVIRNGHLYLILYPFGEKKALTLNFNGSRVSQIPLPRNKPVSYTEAPPIIQETTKAIMQHLPKAEALHEVPPMSNHMTMTKDTVPSEYQAPASDVSKLRPHSTSTHSVPDHSSHVHGHMHHHMMSATPSGHTTFNDTTIRNFLSPLDKFMSPWKSLNFSNVFPFPKRNTTSRQTGEDDGDLDVVTFIAQATDPFERIKSIMESIANTSLFNTTNSDTSPDANNTKSQPESKFNFELKIQTATIDQTRDFKPSPTTSTQSNNENNSEEMLYDTSTGTNTAKSMQPDVTKDLKADQTSFFQGISQPPSVNLMNEYLREVRVSPTIGMALESVTSGFKLHTMEKVEKLPETTKAPEQIKTTSNENVTKDKVINLETQEPFVQNSEIQVTEGLSFEEKDRPTLPSAAEITTPQMESKPSSTTQTILSKTLVPPRAIIGDFIPYKVFNETNPTSQQKIISDTRHNDYSDNNNYPALHKPGSRIVPGKLSTGSNIQPVAAGSQRLTRGQAEQVMSLSDILNDIRRIQLHNMHKFNIQNNNFNNLIVNEASRQNKLRTPMVVEGPLFQETSTRRFSSRPSSRQRPVTDSSLQSQLLEQRQNVINDALDAMLVLSVDDILADHTTLHGAIVMSQRQRDQSNSS